jgi:hypothetical protein
MSPQMSIVEIATKYKYMNTFGKRKAEAWEFEK